MKKITFPLKFGMTNTAVVDLQIALHSLLDRRLILQEQDENARLKFIEKLKLELADKKYGGTTASIVRVFQAEQQLLGVDTGGIDKQTADALNRLLEVHELTLFTVKGKVQQADGVPVIGSVVSAFDRDLRSETILGKTTTDTKGFYEIQYSSESFFKRERATADLLVRAFDKNGKKTIATSKTFFNAGLNTTINLVVGDEEFRGACEYDFILEKIKPLLGKLKISELVEDKKHDDISFLSNEIEVDTAIIALLPTSHQLAGTTKIPADIFYALFRQKYPQQLDYLLLVKSESLLEGINKAIEQNIIAVRSSAAITVIIQQFTQLATSLVLSQGTSKNDSFKKMISTALKDTKLQKIFVDTLFETEATPEKFLEKLADKEGFTDGNAIEKLKHMLQINLLTGNVAALTTSLFEEQSSNPTATDILDFTKFTLENWQLRINNLVKSGELTEFPREVEGATNDQKAKHYAELLDEKINSQFPVEVFKHRLENDPNHPFKNGKGDLSNFFKNNPNFDLKTTVINSALNAADFAGVSQKEPLKTTLTQISRLYKLAPKYETTSVLLADGLESAASIVQKYSKAEFSEKFNHVLGKQKVSTIYRQAEKVDYYSSAVALSYKMSADIPAAALQDQPSADYQSMFGDNHLCDCEHCQSVNSPAAYLVDMLRFIYRADTDAKLALNRRRPDLENVLLTCENTNTRLPYIDLVNELLADFISSGIQTHQTLNTAAELAAYPEHVNDTAYGKLNQSSSAMPLPANLPLNVALEDTRAYLKKLDCKRYQLMELFYANNGDNKYTDAAIATEYLGLSQQDVTVLKKDFSASISIVDGTVRLDTFLDITNLTYVEMVQLLECYFINPNSDDPAETRLIKIVAILSADVTTCDPKKLNLTGITLAIIKEIFPFIRLWRHLGWDIFDVDRLINALAIKTFEMPEQNFHENLIIPLSHITRLINRFNIDVATVLGFWTGIDTSEYFDHSKQGEVIPSLYTELFQNKQVSNPIDEDFQVLLAPQVPLALQVNLSEKTALITGAYKITESEFNLLNTVLINNDALSLDNLSMLYRHTVLAKAMRLKIEDVLLSIELTGINPFAGVSNTVLLLDFIEKVQLIKTSGFSLLELKNLLNNSLNDELTVDENSIAAVLTALREGLKKLELHFPNTANDTDQAKELLIAQEQLLADTFGTEFNLESKIVSVMLNNLVNSTADNTRTSISLFIDDSFIRSTEPVVTTNANGDPLWLFTDLVTTYITLHDTGSRLAQLMDKLSLSIEEFIYFQKNESTFDIVGIWNLPSNNSLADSFAAFENLLYLLKFKNTLLHRNEDWFSLFDSVNEIAVGSKSEFIASLIDQSGVSKSIFQTLLGSESNTNDKGALGFSFSTDYINGECLLNLMLCINKSEQLGTTPNVLFKLTTALVTGDESETAKGILKQKYDNKTWLDIIKPISNQLRERTRDALVSYILTSSESELIDFRAKHQIKDSNALFHYFLIDTQMAACMMTSRIKQANNSIQLFIDRCLMGLELDVSLNEDFAEQWNTWRKQYRVWDANLRVFLYPENWIEPELRDDKSPFFKELESKLAQSEITDETAKDALLEYLEKLDTVANLEIMGLFPDEETGIEHIIGRTKAQPHQYYYRTQQQSRWSPWEKVELDIEGDHLIPVVWNNRLMLFWGTFTEKQQKNPDNKTASISLPNEDNDGKITSDTPITHLEMKLNWSEYKNGKWGAKKISKQVAELGEAKKINLSLYTDIVNGFLRLHVKRWKTSDARLYLEERSLFQFKYCNDEPSNQNLNNVTDRTYVAVGSTPTNLHFEGLKAFSLFDSGFFNIYQSSDAKNTIFTKNTSSVHYKILPNHHQILTAKPIKLFYSNERSTFYARDINAYRHIREPIGDNVLSAEVLTLAARITVTPEPVEPINTPSAILDKQRISLNLATSNTAVTNATAVIVDGPLANDFVNAPVDSFDSKKKVYQFQTFYHPYVCEFIKRINTDGIDALYKEGVQQLSNSLFFKTNYDPTDSVRKPYPTETVDFSFSGAYASYNWELFFHIPLLIATRLLQDKKHDDARRWFHHIFDPTNTTLSEEGNNGAERFWLMQPFKTELANQILSIEELVNNQESQAELNAQLRYWRSNPFNPHGVARLRVSAYMRSTLMKYIDNLIEWGDQLFRRDTIESINEATLLYVLAANLLGEKPKNIPARAQPQINSFATAFSAQQTSDSFTNTKVAIESFLHHSDFNESNSSSMPPPMPLFCIPKNTQLLTYWDSVADRLFKLRNCMNIAGVVRVLPTFEPPIDPGLFVRASALGLDLNNVLGTIDAPLPHYRFQVMVQRAKELSNYVKGLGGQLLSALEKKEGEELSLLRSGQEINVLNLMSDIKKNQVKEAKENLKGLIESHNITTQKHDYFDSKEYQSENEKQYFLSIDDAIKYQEIQSGMELFASLLYLLPEIKIGSGFTIGATYGGANTGNKMRAVGSSFGALASWKNLQGVSANLQGSNERRQEEWDYQVDTAKLELKQIEKQIIAAEIRIAITEKELTNHDTQIENSKEVDDYMRSKFTNMELYDWMARQISSVYFQAYQLAHDFARKTEQCYRFELGNEDTFISYGYWNSMKKGLQSADHLLHDIHRMETSYIDNDKWEYELIKNISLIMLDPLALIQLKATGQCEFEIPEVVYDLDHAGQYFRRIKSVSLSLPCVVGPYTSVSAKLTLKKSSYRKNPNSDNQAGTGYVEDTNNDERFSYNNAAAQSIATSTGQNDSGVFELNFNDQRYLPFEGTGANSTWNIELPNKVRQFDFNSISDVLLHIKYTAREGGSALKELAENALQTQLDKIKTGLAETGLHIAIELNNDLPNEWHLLSNNGFVDMKIDKSRLPFMVQAFDTTIENVIFLVKIKDSTSNSFTMSIKGSQHELVKLNEMDLYKGEDTSIRLNEPFALSVEQGPLKNLEQLIIVVKFSF